MTIVLDHLSIPARDKVATAEWYAHVFGVRYAGPRRDFAPVAVTGSLTLNFETSDVPEAHHYAFMVAADEFAAIRQRLEQASIPYGSSTRDSNGEVYNHDGRRGFYFTDPNGHGLEVMAPSATT
ncbi:MAG TPA: VOC family protein [Chloroflexota bacterium]|nr:VOC family protein [Chloroflexota bacterium]